MKDISIVEQIFNYLHLINERQLADVILVKRDQELDGLYDLLNFIGMDSFVLSLI